MVWKRKTRIALSLAALLGMGLGGCTRRFFRERADKEVDALLASKDHHQDWKLEFWRPYPDPRARFASPGNQDRPPMPPDDPAARFDSPNPQNPGKAGVGSLEGTGYLELLGIFDAENRGEELPLPESREPEVLPQPRPSDPAQANPEIIQTQATQPVPLTRPRSGMDGDNPIPYGVPGDYAEQGERRYPDLETEPGLGEASLRQPLTYARKPYRIKMQQACELALVNSREYMTRREDVYLAALPVTLQRFSFTAQFFAAENAVREWSGKNQGLLRNGWRLSNPGSEIGFTKAFSTGALLLFRFANEIVVEFGRGQTQIVTPSVMTLEVFQPLFRGGGRAVTLEPLTAAERALLYAIRYYARFRKEFYAYLIGGGQIQRQALNSTEAPLSLAAGAPGSGFISPFIQVNVGERAGYAPGPGQFEAPNTGFLPLLLRVGLLINLRENVASLQKYFDQYRDLSTGGDIPELQVARVRQQLLDSQIQTVTAEQLVRDFMDQFKLQLGLPPVLPIELDDTFLRQPMEQLDRLQKLTDDLDNARKKARLLNDPTKAKALRGEFEKILRSSEVISQTKYKDLLFQTLERFGKLNDESLIKEVREISNKRKELRDLSVVRKKEGKDLTEQEIITLRDVEFRMFVGRFERSMRIYERQPWLRNGTTDKKIQDDLFQDLQEDFLLMLVEPRNERLTEVRKMWSKLPRLCVDSVDLTKASLSEALWTAGRHALTHRLDLMNARAQLTDAWRQIRVAANSLMGYVDIGYGGEFLTPVDAAKPLSFSGMGRQRLRIRADAPLVRIAERNNYRAVLINWQRMRRNLMAFEDSILLTVRTEVRQLRALARNYELQKQAVELAYDVVDNAVDLIYQPKTPTGAGAAGGGGGGGGGSQDIVALTQQLLQAQQQKLGAQNQLITTWINFQTFRIALYRDLELMPLDSQGVWIDDIAESECCDEGRTESGGGRGSENPAGSGGDLPNPTPNR